MLLPKITIDEWNKLTDREKKIRHIAEVHEWITQTQAALHLMSGRVDKVLEWANNNPDAPPPLLHLVWLGLKAEMKTICGA